MSTSSEDSHDLESPGEGVLILSWLFNILAGRLLDVRLKYSMSNLLREIGSILFSKFIMGVLLVIILP